LPIGDGEYCSVRENSLKLGLLPLPVVAIGLWSLCSLQAQDAGAATINAANCSGSAVSAALSSAANGDTINVPAGTCTWSSIPIGKQVTLRGAGIDVTRISCSGGECVDATAPNVRVTGFTFSSCDNCVIMQGVGWRVDRNKFTNTSWVTGVLAHGGQSRVTPSGLVDNNTFNNGKVMAAGTNFMRNEGDYQDVLWAQDPGFGTSSGVYIEDNSFANGINAVDCSYAGRFVFRFNTVTNTYLEIHSVQGNNRACQRWEIYKNQLTNTTWTVAFIRGGSGYVFGNTNNNGHEIAVNNVRDLETRETSGRCNGTSNWDQNTPGQAGYACRDQIGRSRDSVQWTTGAPYNQPLTPAYIFGNTTSYGGGQQIAVDLHNPSSPNHIVANRDFYWHSASFNGTSGVGSGNLAARPSTCTKGVGYWASDQGSWNALGPSGVLYTCVATNSWGLNYTPYTYPHPLQNSTTLPAPSNLRLL
jgi:hypothetical protein